MSLLSPHTFIVHQLDFEIPIAKGVNCVSSLEISNKFPL